MDDDTIGDSQKLMINSYKIVCAKLGFIMCVFYACRILNGFVADMISGWTDAVGKTAMYIMHVALAVLLIYCVPILITSITFKSFSFYKGKLRELYKKPRRLSRTLGNFPALYGLGYGTAFLTLVASLLLLKVSGGHSIIEDLFKPTVLESSSDITSVVAMVFVVVVIAPIFEEFWVRGIIFDALKPYGCGMAIIISSVLFGLMHGSLYMLFYTTVIGFALGYIRYATDSVFVTTLLHTAINAVAAGLLLISSLAEITGGESSIVNTIMGIYILAVLILVLIGIIAFIKKIPRIRKYKIENAWTGISPGKKTALFFLSIPVLFMLILAINEHANNLLLDLIIR